MSGIISGNMVGGASPLKTLKLVDSDGVELVGVVVGKETIFTAGDNDVREGKVYASDNGVSTGTKNIPAYRTTQGTTGIPSGSSFSIKLPQYNKYDYTKLQCLIAPFNTNMNNSVLVDKTVINDSTYAIGSTEKISDVSKNHNTMSIDLNITNTSDKEYVIRFFTYREEL